MYALFESAKYIRPNPFDMSLVNSRWQMFKMEKKRLLSEGSILLLN